ncbi:MAG: GNAT family N-acetyltransferase [Actinobacteria bacterium]|nr:GNAT family N-acetyltransferase [Actinomycetota bacterium]
MTRSSVRVRCAELADVDALVALSGSVDAARGTFGGRATGSEHVDFAARFTDILSRESRTVLVAEDDSVGGVIGFVVVTDDEIAAINPTRVVNISHLIVAPRLRRRGVGRALLAAVVHLAEDRGIDHVVATAGSGSREANRYLARLGFAPLVVRRIAPTSVLRRSVGISEVPDRLALRRRMRNGPAPLRGVASIRSISRGA